MHFNVNKNFPYYVSIVDTKTNIQFYDKEGNQLSTFCTKDILLKEIPDYDIETMVRESKLNIGIFGIRGNHFLIFIENYVIVSHLYFDDKL